MILILFLLQLSLCIAKSHLKSYPCPKNFNYLWNQGFLIILAMLLQILTGILLGLHYTSEMNYAYYSVMHIIREVYRRIFISNTFYIFYGSSHLNSTY